MDGDSGDWRGFQANRVFDNFQKKAILFLNHGDSGEIRPFEVKTVKN